MIYFKRSDDLVYQDIETVNRNIKTEMRGGFFQTKRIDLPIAQFA